MMKRCANANPSEDLSSMSCRFYMYAYFLKVGRMKKQRATKISINLLLVKQIDLASDGTQVLFILEKDSTPFKRVQGVCAYCFSLTFDTGVEWTCI